eukprot:TRINITY_DN23626_c0_g1_i1.p1 TRINITY_DN23626_c0_g1~~TRINITY_DN23626_c0_g1_i1.p1  ORF type:complete len:250 (-),score=47.57 TRINITY_DN23626_c0_g1_i1:423-1127(-)
MPLSYWPDCGSAGVMELRIWQQRGLLPRRHRSAAMAVVAASLAAVLVSFGPACRIGTRVSSFVFAGSRGASEAVATAATARQRHLRRAQESGEAGVDAITLPPMDSDEPAWLAFVMASYLDEEWIEQPCHQVIGQEVGDLYKQAREDGQDDVMAILAGIAFGLKENWKEKPEFQEAFEGPADIANRAVEFLMLRMGRNVFSYGQSNNDVQDRMKTRLACYEASRAEMAKGAADA